VLGARRVLAGIDGTARFNEPARVDPQVPLTSDLVTVKLGKSGEATSMSNSRPFLAFMSDNQDWELSGGCPGLPPLEADCDRGCATRKARVNRHPWQRAVKPDCPFAFAKQVRAWYGAVALSAYAPAVQPALRQAVRSLGVGPWLSGLWWGDSQLGLLAMWIAHAIAAPTWASGAGSAKEAGGGTGNTSLPLDYYIYSAFTENPGNQCYVHAGKDCKSCLQHCGTPPASAYWLPGFAYTGVPPDYTSWDPPPPPARACVADAGSCGARGLGDVAKAYAGKGASALWDDVERALSGGQTGTNVFDGLLAAAGP